MANFDFITDGPLRRSLESDLRELTACHEVGAWKAVLVLAGSIIEAILIEHLVSSQNIGADAAYAKDLGKLIELCKQQAILSNKAIELSAIIRSYRNLIHPGRLLRLAEGADEHGATIAKSVIEIVVNEVSEKKRSSYGYTAEQVVRKVKQDPSSISIAEHLLRETPADEIKRLLLDVLPTFYLQLSESDDRDDASCAKRLGRVYRIALEISDAQVRKLVGAKYVSVIKEESETTVRNYELGLFRGSDRKYIDEKDQPLVVAHFLATMRQRMTEEVAEAAQGITEALDERLLKEFLRIISATLVRDRPANIRAHPAATLLDYEAWKTHESSNKLLPIIQELNEEHKWSGEQTKRILEEMEMIVRVPF